MLPDLKQITGAAWRAAKKQAGVKGAGFFDGAGSKAVADKIDRYQQKKATYKGAKTSKNFQDLVSALLDLETALTKAEADRSFKSDLAKEMQADIGKLLKEVDVAKLKLGKIATDKEAMKQLDQEGATEMNKIIDEFVF